MQPVQSPVSHPAATPCRLPFTAKRTLQEELASYKGTRYLDEKTKFIGKIVQSYMPTTEKSKSHNKTAYFESHGSIKNFQEIHKEQHRQDFKDLCAFFRIIVTETQDQKTPFKFQFFGCEESFQFQGSNKNLYKIISRMIESVSLVQGMPEALCFSKFLCECFPKDRIENKDLFTARQFWLTAWAPQVQRHPGGEFLKGFHLDKFRSSLAVRPVQEVFNLCCNFEDLKEIFEQANENLVFSQQEPRLESPQLPSYVTNTVHIGEKTQIHFAPCTSVTAIRDFTKTFGSELGVLNFANAYRVGGGVLGFGRVQEEGLFQRTTMFSLALEEMMRGEVTFLPEHRTVGKKLATIFHEGEYTKQLEYSEARTAEIEGRADHGCIVLNPTELTENYLAVIIKDDNCKELKACDQMPFVVLTAALSDRSRTAAVASKTPGELAATADAPGSNAPYTGEEIQAVKKTLTAVLKTAEAAGLEELVLGAIGCGAFGHIPETIAGIFKDLLSGDFRDKFKHVIFAIPGPTSRNFTAFQDVFTEKDDWHVVQEAEVPTATAE